MCNVFVASTCRGGGMWSGVEILTSSVFKMELVHFSHYSPQYQALYHVVVGGWGMGCKGVLVVGWGVCGMDGLGDTLRWWCCGGE